MQEQMYHYTLSKTYLKPKNSTTIQYDRVDTDHNKQFVQFRHCLQNRTQIIHEGDGVAGSGLGIGIVSRQREMKLTSPGISEHQASYLKRNSNGTKTKGLCYYIHMTLLTLFLLNSKGIVNPIQDRRITNKRTLCATSYNDECTENVTYTGCCPHFNGGDHLYVKTHSFTCIETKGPILNPTQVEKIPTLHVTHKGMMRKNTKTRFFKWIETKGSILNPTSDCGTCSTEKQCDKVIIITANQIKRTSLLYVPSLMNVPYKYSRIKYISTHCKNTFDFQGYLIVRQDGDGPDGRGQSQEQPLHKKLDTEHDVELKTEETNFPISIINFVKRKVYSSLLLSSFYRTYCPKRNYEPTQRNFTHNLYRQVQTTVITKHFFQNTCDAAYNQGSPKAVIANGQIPYVNNARKCCDLCQPGLKDILKVTAAINIFHMMSMPSSKVTSFLFKTLCKPGERRIINVGINRLFFIKNKLNWENFYEQVNAVGATNVITYGSVNILGNTLTIAFTRYAYRRDNSLDIHAIIHR
jgi:hypothetical protein